MKPRLEVLKTVVSIVAIHHTVDDEWYDYVDVDVANLHPGDEIHIEDDAITKITVVDLTPEKVTLNIDGQYITATLGETTVGRAWLLPGSPDREEIKVSVSYAEWTLYNVVIDEINHIGELHFQSDSSVHRETADRERTVITHIDELIAKERVGLYPLKALLMSSNHWGKMIIVRHGMFQDILLEGIGKGALAPDDQLGWSWMHTAAINNDPALFMADTDRYYDLLMEAVANGNEDARDIMDQIWEPENCQEED